MKYEVLIFIIFFDKHIAKITEHKVSKKIDFAATVNSIL